MKYRFMIFYTLVLMIIFTIGCSCQSQIDGMSVAEAEDKCASKSDPSHCYKDLGQDNNNPEICLKSPRAGPASKCIMEVAATLLDENLCNLMPEGAGAYSKDECYLQVAIAKNDQNICQNVGDYMHSKTDVTKFDFDRTTCIEKSARGEKKESLCGDINEFCCAYDRCDVAGTTCNENNICVPCGFRNNICCPNDYCDADEGAMCVDGKCEPCGDIGMQCCKDSPRCLDGTCSGNVCTE